MKNRIKLNESDLHRIIKQSVNRVINESKYSGEYYTVKKIWEEFQNTWQSSLDWGQNTELSKAYSKVNKAFENLWYILGNQNSNTSGLGVLGEPKSLEGTLDEY